MEDLLKTLLTTNNNMPSWFVNLLIILAAIIIVLSKLNFGFVPKIAFDSEDALLSGKLALDSIMRNVFASVYLIVGIVLLSVAITALSWQMLLMGMIVLAVTVSLQVLLEPAKGFIKVDDVYFEIVGRRDDTFRLETVPSSSELQDRMIRKVKFVKATILLEENTEIIFLTRKQIADERKVLLQMSNDKSTEDPENLEELTFSEKRHYFWLLHSTNNEYFNAVNNLLHLQ